MSRRDFSIGLFLQKVRDRKELDVGEVDSFINNLNVIPDEQVAAFLAHAYHQPLSSRDMVELTCAMRDSGRVMSWPGVNLPVVDKHSTGGVGDKISICLAPLLAVCDVAVPMVSGRGLGFTGGTVDKLESIPGFSCALAPERISSLVKELGLALGSQTDDFAPADKRLYALRDVTGTVESIPLITASILSKKLAEGLKALVLDVKFGSGSFMGSIPRARALAESLVKTATDAGVNTVAYLTSMDQPLGSVSGNWCEVSEAVTVLKDHKRAPQDVVELTLVFAESLLLQSGVVSTLKEGRTKSMRALESGKAFEKWLSVVRAQGGKTSVFEKDMKDFLPAAHVVEVKAARDGIISEVDTRAVGMALVLARAGREKKTDTVAANTGLKHERKIGDKVRAGETLCVLYTDESQRLKTIETMLRDAYRLTDEVKKIPVLVHERLESGGKNR